MNEAQVDSKFQVSFMGQGEPLLNEDSVFEFCGELCRVCPEVIIGISTAGIAGGIAALSRQAWAEQVKLQISLHWWPANKRQKIVPAEVLYPVEDALCEARRMGKKWRKRYGLNCVLLDGINDSAEDAQRIAEVAASGPFYVKVSEFNPYEGCVFAPARYERVERYCEIVRANNIDVHRFRSIGTAIGAGCGQTRLRAGDLPPVRAENVRDTVDV
jgi:23S rRNA (adenine2503-C2)-methyltransferase